MPKTTYIVNSLLLIFIIVISVITYQSSDVVIEEAGEIAKETFFSNEIPEENYQGTYFSFYLPESMEVKEVDANNAILHHGEQTLIIFDNTLENSLSKLNFNTAKSEEAVLLESFADDNKFGYIRLLPDEEKKDVFQLQVGVGGVKVTTYTKKHEVVLDTEKLMKTALSIAE